MAKNITYPGPEVDLEVTVVSGVVSGSPVMVGGLPGTAIVDRGEETTGKATTKFSTHVADHSVEAKDAEGNNAVAIGDRLYYDSAETIKLNKDNSNGLFYGWALEAITAGSNDTILVFVNGGGAGEPAPIQRVQSAVIDLSGAAVADTPVLHTSVALQILGLYFMYQEATSADAGIVIDVGKGGDDDFFFTGSTDVSKSAFDVESKTLLQTALAAGETMTYNSAGGKTGTGTLLIVVEYEQSA